MKIAKLFPKKSKQGVTLVEVVFGVVVLAIIALGIITALTVGSTTIADKAKDSAAHSEAVQKMDAAIAYLSNTTYSSTTKTDVEAIIGVDITMTPEKYLNAANVEVIRGWKLKLTYKGQTVTGYASNTEGVFDKDE